jgi:hypothetical protein
MIKRQNILNHSHVLKNKLKKKKKTSHIPQLREALVLTV